MKNRNRSAQTVRRGENPEDALWRNVISQAIQDATMHISERVHGALRRQREAIREQARDWVQKQSEDFHTVCELAGLEADRVRKFAMAEIIKSIAKEQERVMRENLKGSMPGVGINFSEGGGDRRPNDAQETEKIVFLQNEVSP